jgi:hypothetical protein
MIRLSKNSPTLYHARLVFLNLYKNYQINQSQAFLILAVFCSYIINIQIEPHPNGTIEFKVSHLGEQVMLKPEQVLACLFTHLRYLLVKSMGADVTECVINVRRGLAIPTYNHPPILRYHSSLENNSAFQC